MIFLKPRVLYHLLTGLAGYSAATMPALASQEVSSSVAESLSSPPRLLSSTSGYSGQRRELTGQRRQSSPGSQLRSTTPIHHHRERSPSYVSRPTGRQEAALISMFSPNPSIAPSLQNMPSETSPFPNLFLTQPSSAPPAQSYYPVYVFPIVSSQSRS